MSTAAPEVVEQRSSSAEASTVPTAAAADLESSGPPQDESNIQRTEAEQNLPTEPTPVDVLPEPSTAVSLPVTTPTNLLAPTTAADPLPTPPTTIMIDERAVVHDPVEHEPPSASVAHPASSSSSYDSFADDLDPSAPSAPVALSTAADTMQSGHVPAPAVGHTQASHASVLPTASATTSSMVSEPTFTSISLTETATQDTPVEPLLTSAPAPATAAVDQEAPPAQMQVIDPFASLSLWGQGQRSSSPEEEEQEPDPFHDPLPSGTTTTSVSQKSAPSAEQGDLSLLPPPITHPAVHPAVQPPEEPWPLQSHWFPSVPMHTGRHSQDIPEVPFRSNTDVPPRTASVPLGVPRPSAPSLSPGPPGPPGIPGSPQERRSMQARRDTNPFRRAVGFDTVIRPATGTATPPLNQPSTQSAAWEVGLDSSSRVGNTMTM